MDEKPYHGVFSPQEASWLLAKFGLQADDRSPLKQFAGDPLAIDESSLMRRGLLSAEWSQAFTVLASPSHQVRAQIPAANETVTAIFYGGLQGWKTRWVGCWAENGNLQVSFPWDQDRILALAWQVLMETDPLPAEGESFEISLPALTALACCIDSIHESYFRSMLDRKPDGTLILTRPSLAGQLERGVARSDARWLVSLLNLVSPPQFPIALTSLPQGIEELVRIGLAIAQGPDFYPSPQLQRLARFWRNTLPAFALESLLVDDGRLSAYAHRIILRGEGPLWQIEYDERIWRVTPQVGLRSINPQECLKGLATILNTPSQVPSQPPQASPSSLPAANEEPILQCQVCGHQLRPNAKFCGNCGAPVA